MSFLNVQQCCFYTDADEKLLFVLLFFLKAVLLLRSPNSVELLICFSGSPPCLGTAEMHNSNVYCT